MAQKSYPWPGVAPASGADAGRYDAPEWWGAWVAAQVGGGVLRAIAPPLRTAAALTNRGVYYFVPNQLVVTTPGANTLEIDTGAALVDGQCFYNDAKVTLTVANNLANHLIVVRKNFTAAAYIPPGSIDVDEQVPAYTSRISRVTALVQDTTRATYWDIPLADFSTNAAGAVTLNSDDRDYVDTGWFTKLDEVVLGAPSAAITFANIPQFWRHLEMIFQARSDRAANADTVWIRFNGDGAANYDVIRADESHPNTLTTAEGLGVAATEFAAITAATGPANYAGGYVSDIHNYSGSTFYKSCTTTGGFVGNAVAGFIYTVHTVVWWRNTAPITQIDLVLAAGDNFIAGSVFSLYGKQ